MHGEELKKGEKNGIQKRRVNHYRAKRDFRG
jgi:hypothetical protein